ncbi:MAG: triose-phosphate isomerase [Actinobacteria bacterium]|uniref:triose-phosphate isomerase n=1 Tax=freshwater metagenome TaxID=449393 RepID=A0A6J6LRI0_9ZZZZ|nr:triose-phosphate isomerase [Actinomycetota bacterium]MSX24667.1 triose-phosphate isomerase [Actinomycetota bacterium]MSY46526.1 triose-phosphate isomerase [Actinomycetota bacterium]MSY57406.1 triose-phosphate isomerase [Actinomycetota bacterium]MTB00007.1 triose-phosphate isomerase [Actinomycetota bacterium]
MRKPLMAGNWKMNLNHLEAIAVTQKLAYSLEDKDFDAVDVAIIPPFTDIRSIQTLVDGDRLRLTYGAQDLSPEAQGAFTGDISGSMLSKLGCTYVLVGHSERRAIHGEDDALLNRKLKAALANDLIAIFCVGEELPIRESGTHVSHVVRQLRAGLAGVTKPEMKKVVIAYEPVWAIGTGKTATPQDAQEVCSAIRGEIEEIGSPEIASAMRILYGGSVKSANIAEIMKEGDVDGALIGGASLDPEELAKIVKFHIAG